MLTRTAILRRLSDQHQVVNTISDLLNANYVSPELGRQAAEYIESRLAVGEYSKIPSASAFADALTADLRSVAHDRHLTVVPDTSVNPPSSVEVIAQNERAAWQAARANYGFEKLEHLPGKVGYLDLRGFSPSEIGGPTAIAAMNFLANSSAVIIDLRQNGGGEPSMIQLITSYLFVASVHPVYWAALRASAISEFSSGIRVIKRNHDRDRSPPALALDRSRRA
jgi:hypothetical protein